VSGRVRFAAESPWIRRAIRRAPRVRLFCFPYAGMGASLFSGWPALLPESVEVVAVQLPGREDRSRHPMPGTLADLVRACALSVLPFATEPFAVYGHCAGALLGYEVACELRVRHGVAPERLLVAAHEAPHLPRRSAPLHPLPDDAFLNEIRRLGGAPEAILRRSDLLEVLLPTLRADFRFFESYVYQDRPPLDCPITVVRGEADTVVAADACDEWSRHTTAEYTRMSVPGGHYFVNEFDATIADRIAAVLAPPAAAAVR
jgi:medium-chain acyl-[acyl-carrier-protein] hydrolase